MPWSKVEQELMQPTSHRRASISLYGGDKDGKTTFALTAPTPIYLLNTNYGYEGLPAFEALRAAGQIRLSDHAMPDEHVLSNYDKVVKQIQADYNDAIATIARDHAGTIVVDKADEVWGILSPVKKDEAQRRRYEEHITSGKDASKFKRMQTDYEDPNLMMRAFVLRPLQFPDVNAVFVHGAKREWKDDGSGPTGKLLFHGFGETGGLTQAHIRIMTEADMIVENGIPTGKFRTETKATIELCRFDRTLQGYQFSPPTWDGFMEALNA